MLRRGLAASGAGRRPRRSGRRRQRAGSARIRCPGWPVGGWRGPLVEAVPLLGLVYFFGKVVLSLFFMIWLRSTHPRLRYDRLMALGWKVLLPLALANVVVTAAALLDRTLLLIVVGVLAAIVVAMLIAWYRRLVRRERARKEARVLTAARRGA